MAPGTRVVPPPRTACGRRICSATHACGALDCFARLLWIGATPGTTHGERKAVWRRFGMWLLLSLEFELAADIIASAISPTWKDIGELGAIAVIRTFLNYFLEQDLERTESSAEPAK
jgi:uncharacterized membrane protein